jgi:peptide/nickel transport system substrate-binding protein
LRLPRSPFAGAVVLAAVVWACRGDRAASSKAKDEVVTLAVRADITGVFPNPPTADEAYTYDVMWNVFESLARFNRRLEPEPALAARWENPDDRTYVFHLKPGLRFSDGRPLTAADVAASLEGPRKHGWVTSSYFRNVESAEAVGPLSLKVRTRFPYFVLLSKLPWGMVLPKEAVDLTPVPSLGSGPYRIESHTVGRELVLVRNDYFQGPPPAFARARFVVEPDAQERIAKLFRGEADVADHVPLDQVDALRQKGLQVFSGPTLRVLFLGLRVDTPPFDDPRVREAIDLSLDREELIRRTYHGRTVPASQIVPPAVVGYNPRIPVTTANRVRARALLAEAGHAQGLTLRLDGPRNRYVYDVEILHEVARQLAEVGIRVEVNAQDKAIFFPLAFQGRSPFHLLGWECQSGEAGQALDVLVHSADRTGFGNTNTSGVKDPTLDELIEAGNRTVNAQARTQALQRALARVAELRPLIPLLIQAEAVAVSPRVRWEPSVRYSLHIPEMSPAR